jgi:hypothetical protein
MASPFAALRACPERSEGAGLDRPLTSEERAAVSRPFTNRPALRDRLQRARLL